MSPQATSNKLMGARDSAVSPGRQSNYGVGPDGSMPSTQQNAHILSKSNIKTQNIQPSAAKPSGNRISKGNLREGTNNLKDYGMNIITGGNKAQGTNAQAMNKTPIKSGKGYAGIDIHE